MKLNRTTAAAFGATTLTLCSCASIISGSTNPVTISSAPAAAAFTITDKEGRVVHSGTTPQTVTLEAGHGYFGAARYDITVKKDGYAAKTYPVIAGLNGWYFANLLFGGLIGMLIVDPVTGAMYKLPKDAVIQLDAQQASGAGTLKVMTLDAVPEEFRGELVRLN